MKPIGLWLGIVGLVGVSGIAQALSETSSVVIPWGLTEKTIATIDDNGKIAAPFLFDVDDEGTIYIPNYYAGRISAYTSNGTWKKNIAVSDLTPRLRFFKYVASQKLFIMVNDQTLSTVDQTGTTVGSRNFGLAIPSLVYPTRSAIFLVFRSGETSYTISTDYRCQNPERLELASWQCALIRTNSGQLLPPLAKDYRAIRGPTSSPPAGSTLAGLFGDNLVWSDTANQGSVALWSVNGSASSPKLVAISFSPRLTTDGAWLVLVKSGRLAFLSFQTDIGLKIVGYGIE